MAAFALPETLQAWLGDWLEGDPSDESFATQLVLFLFLLVLVFQVVVELVYFVVAERVTGGASFGKRIARLRVVRDGGRRLDLVMSDMAPNMSGLTAVDQPKAMYLVELATDLAYRALSPGGALVTKVFQGEGFEAWFHQIRGRFERVVTRKPTASRPRSREVYVVATGLKVADRAA